MASYSVSQPKVLNPFRPNSSSFFPKPIFATKPFFGFTSDLAPERTSRFYFRHRRNGITISFTREEWQSLKELFEKALATPELQPVLEELSLVYGEI